VRTTIQTQFAFECEGRRSEIVDIDGRRIDKVLASRLPTPVGDAFEDQTG